MNKVATISTKGHNNKPRPIRLLVVKTMSNTVRLEASLADPTGCIKAYVYPEEKHKYFQPNRSVFIDGYTLGTKTNVIMIGSRTTVSASPRPQQQDVPDIILAQAEMLVDPPPAAPTHIADLKANTEGVTVEGRVIQVIKAKNISLVFQWHFLSCWQTHLQNASSTDYIQGCHQPIFSAG